LSVRRFWLICFLYQELAWKMLIIGRRTFNCEIPSSGAAIYVEA